MALRLLGCRPMPSRTHQERRAAHPDLRGSYDVIVCGASFAGLAVARELAGARRPDGGRPGCWCSTATRSASARPRPAPPPPRWLEALGLRPSHAADLRLAGRPHAARDRAMPAALDASRPSTTALLCALLADQNDAEFEIATVDRARVDARATALVAVTTDRGEVSAPLVVDALGWRRVLGHGRLPAARGPAVARPRGAPGRHRRRRSRSGSTARSCRPATAGASRPTTRCASASARSTRGSTCKEPTAELAERLERDADALPGQLDPAPAARAPSTRTCSSPATRPATACR